MGRHAHGRRGATDRKGERQAGASARRAASQGYMPPGQRVTSRPARIRFREPPTTNIRRCAAERPTMMLRTRAPGAPVSQESPLAPPTQGSYRALYEAGFRLGHQMPKTVTEAGDQGWGSPYCALGTAPLRFYASGLSKMACTCAVTLSRNSCVGSASPSHKGSSPLSTV